MERLALVLAAPIALGTGTAAMTVVYVGLGDDPASEHYRFSLSLGGMGMTFVTILIAGFLAGIGLANAFVAGAGTGMLAAVGVYVERGR